MAALIIGIETSGGPSFDCLSWAKTAVLVFSVIYLAVRIGGAFLFWLWDQRDRFRIKRIARRWAARHGEIRSLKVDRISRRGQIPPRYRCQVGLVEVVEKIQVTVRRDPSGSKVGGLPEAGS